MEDSALDLRPLQRALLALQRSLAFVDDRDWFGKQPEALQETVMAGAIQHFELVYELSVKMLRRTLEREADNPAVIDALSYRDMLRSAFEKGLVTDVLLWFDYRKLRNITTHTYDEDKVREVLVGIHGFMAEAQRLLDRLEARRG